MAMSYEHLNRCSSMLKGRKLAGLNLQRMLDDFNSRGVVLYNPKLELIKRVDNRTEYGRDVLEGIDDLEFGNCNGNHPIYRRTVPGYLTDLEESDIVEIFDENSSGLRIGEWAIRGGENYEGTRVIGVETSFSVKLPFFDGRMYIPFR